MERREFLKWLSVASASSALLSCTTKEVTPSPTVTSGYAPGHDKGYFFLFLEDYAQKKRTLRKYDWNTYEFADYPLPLPYAHSLLQDRQNPEIVYVFEMFGSFARIDLRTKETMVIDHRSARDMFYGHASQNTSGHLFCTQLDSDLTRGIITIRDPKTMRRIGRLPVECNGAHQVLTLPGAKLGACGVSDEFGKNPRAAGAVTFFDCDTYKVTNRVELPHPVSHVFAYSKDEIVTLTIQIIGLPLNPKYDMTSRQNAPGLAKADPSPIYLVKSDGTYREFLDGGEKDLFRFNFGFSKVPNSDLMLTSHVGSDRVLLWNGRGEIVTKHELGHPGVILVSNDGKEFVVTTNGKAKVISLSDHRVVREFVDDQRVLGLAAYKS